MQRRLTDAFERRAKYGYECGLRAAGGGEFPALVEASARGTENPDSRPTFRPYATAAPRPPCDPPRAPPRAP
jgi:hypothetical protein